MLRPIKVFISHCDRQDEASRLKTSLDTYYGAVSFVAPKDIDPGNDFIRTILVKINSTDLFIPLISTGTKHSEWQNQEIGRAIDKTVIFPVKIDANPSGALSSMQALEFPSEDWGCDQLDDGVPIFCDKLMGAFLNRVPMYRKKVIDGLIVALGKSPDFVVTKKIIKKIQLDKVTSDQANKILRAYIHTREFYGEQWVVPQFIENLIDLFKGELNQQYLTFAHQIKIEQRKLKGSKSNLAF